MPEVVLVVVSTSHRALNVRQQLSSRVPDVTFEVINTDGPVMDCPYELGIDPETVRPKWLKAHSGSAKRLLSALKNVSRVVVLHCPTEQECGYAYLVEKLVDKSVPVTCVPVPDFHDVLPYIVGTKTCPFSVPFSVDTFEAQEVRNRVASTGRKLALAQLPNVHASVRSFRVPAQLAYLLQQAATTTTQETTSWVATGTGDGFVAESTDCSSEEEARAIAQKLTATIAVSKTETAQTVNPPRIPTFEDLAQRAANSGISLTELWKSLEALVGLGLVGFSSSGLPAEVSDTARLVIEETCGPEFVGQANPRISSGTVWFAVDAGKRPSEQPLTTAMRTVYGILWSVTVGAHSIPAAVKHQVLSYREHNGRRLLVSASGLVVEDQGWYRPSLAPSKHKPLPFDVALSKIDVVSRTQHMGGLQESDLSSFNDIPGIVDALVYAKESGLLATNAAGRLALTETGQVVLDWFVSLDMMDLPPSNDASADYQAALRWVKNAEAMADNLPNKCPKCSAKVSVHPQMKPTRVRCRKCKTTSTLARLEGTWKLL